MTQHHFETALIHGGYDSSTPHADGTGAVNVPVYLSSTFRQPAPGQHTGYEYSRTGNPTRSVLEALVAELEGGVASFAFASGMAAITACISLLNSGDTVIISQNVYGGTYRVLDKVFTRFGINYLIEDTNDVAALSEKLTPDVKAVLVETPANPLLTVTDIAALAKLTKAHGILLMVDNTFMTPYLQRPLELGADIVIHSATKYLGGHSDLIAGLVVVSTAELAEKIHFILNSTGGILQPFDSYLLVRSIRSLGVRMDRHVANAEAVAEYLNKHPAVSAVYYPGMPDNPGFETQQQQAKNGGAMVSFELADGYDVTKFFTALKLVVLAESLGGVETLVGHPVTMTHASIPPELRAKMGITDRLIRLSVGIENVADIIADLDKALESSAEMAG